MRKIPIQSELLDEAYRFEFFQAVRLLEKMYPAKRSVGGDALPHEEIVRFRSRVAFDFPSSEIHEINQATEETHGDDRLEMVENFMAMAGVSGVLPTHYTELVYSRIRYRDTAMWSFLDIFTHRAVSMFYRAWEKYRFPVGYERGEDAFTQSLFDFCGLGTRGLRGRMAVEDEALLPYTGLIAQKPHSTKALENIVSDYFGIRVKVKQFFGQWLSLGPQDVTMIGTQNFVLGRNAIVGSKVWDQQSKFRVELGPLTFAQYQAFLPNGNAHKVVKSIIKFFAGMEFDYDLRLTLLGKQVPGCILTTRAQRKPMLGWTTFLKTQPVAGIDEQLVLSSTE